MRLPVDRNFRRTLFISWPWGNSTWHVHAFCVYVGSSVWGPCPVKPSTAMLTRPGTSHSHWSPWTPWWRRWWWMHTGTSCCWPGQWSRRPSHSCSWTQAHGHHGTFWVRTSLPMGGNGNDSLLSTSTAWGRLTPNLEDMEGDLTLPGWFQPLPTLLHYNPSQNHQGLSIHGVVGIGAGFWDYSPRRMHTSAPWVNPGHWVTINTQRPLSYKRWMAT